MSLDRTYSVSKQAKRCRCFQSQSEQVWVFGTIWGRCVMAKVYKGPTSFIGSALILSAGITASDPIPMKKRMTNNTNLPCRSEIPSLHGDVSLWNCMWSLLFHQFGVCPSELPLPTRFRYRNGWRVKTLRADRKFGTRRCVRVKFYVESTFFIGSAVLRRNDRFQLDSDAKTAYKWIQSSNLLGSDHRTICGDASWWNFTEYAFFVGWGCGFRTTSKRLGWFYSYYRRTSAGVELEAVIPTYCTV